MLVKTYCAAVNGMGVTTVTTEISLTNGIMHHFTGLGDEAIKEGRNRIAAAMQFNDCKLPHADITVNMAPADLRKEGSNFDLPLAIAVLAANDSTISEVFDQYMMVGELSLDGTLQTMKSALPIVIRVRKERFKGLIVPEQNVRETTVINNLEVYGMDSMMDVMRFLTDAKSFGPTVIDTRKEFYEHQYRFDLDYSDIQGQENVKRALEIVAAGGYNLIMMGPPGSGKSMMAKRLPTILPPLTLAESLGTTRVHSIVDELGTNTSLIAQRPLRTLHHTINEMALVGGGSTPQPGEIILAYHSVLLCDEPPGFNKSTLEVLHQPLEDQKVTISRTEYTIEYPCSFMFVASISPYPYGYYGDPTHTRACTPGQIQRYLSKISGPLLDRIDIQCEITPVPFKDTSKVAPEEPSAGTRERVIAARAIQIERYKDCKGIYCSAQMTERMIHRFAEPNADGINMLRMVAERLSLSAWAYNRVLRVAHTVADLEGSEPVRTEYLAEAIGYRSLDRGDWAERQRSRKQV